MSNINDATSASTKAFVTSLVFNAVVFAAELAAFTLLRPYFPAIYQPRTYVPPEGKRAQSLTHNLFLWPLAVFNADYRAIKEANGLDAYFFVRFLRMVTRILLPIWLISWAVLLPLTSVRTSNSGKTGLDKFSFGNVGTNSQSRYAAHLILAWFFTIWIWWNIKREMAHFITMRQRWLIEPSYANSAQASTVLIRGVPQRYLTESALTKLFSYLPGGVAKVWLNRDLKDMPDLYDRRLAACKKLESAETSLLNTATKLRNKQAKQQAKQAKKMGNSVGNTDVSEAGRTSDSRPLTDPSIMDADTERNLPLAEVLVPKDKRPTHRLPLSFLPFSLPLIGEIVDSIDWARDEIVNTSAELKERRRTLAVDVAHSSTLPPPATNHPDTIKPQDDSQTYPPLNSAFILFNRQIAAHLSAQSLTHHEPYRMAERHLGVDPSDVIWANLNMNPYEARIRVAISWGFTLGLIILWAFPVAFVGIVSNIPSLCLTYSWLAWICKLPSVIVGIISGILPPVLLAVLMMLLPIVLRLLSKFEGTPTRSAVELSLMNRFFLFQVLHSFLIVTLAAGIIASLETLLKNPASIPSTLATYLPQASNFFLTYIILQGLSGTAAGFLTIVPLILYYVKLFILGSTPRSVYKIKYGLRNVSWGTLFPSTTLLLVITLAYSIISPIINGLACFSFFLFYQLWKYLFLWQLEQPKSGETGGLFFPKAIQHVFVGMYIQQICLAGLFFLAQDENKKSSAVPEGALMVVLIAFTAFFHLIIVNSYWPLIHALPLSLADRTHGIDDNRRVAEQELADDASIAETPEKTTDVALRRRSSAATNSSFHTADGKANRTSPSLHNSPTSASQSSEDPNLPDPNVKPVDEDAGPKEFYHPASVEPQQVVWLPQDVLGLAEAEERENRERGILVSSEDARMDAKGHVDIQGTPPGGEVRTL